MHAAQVAREEDPTAAFARPVVVHVQCPSCGYEPPTRRPLPVACPKCHGGCWEHFTWRGRLRVWETD